MTEMNTSKKIYTFLGLPASGKGTQVDFFSKEQNLPVISIGDLVRERMEKDPESEETQAIKDKYAAGTPQDDDLVFGLIKEKLASIDGGVIFDNFPFSEQQAEFLFRLADEGNYGKPNLIFIDIAPETAIERVSKRGVCPDCKAIFNQGEEVCDRCGAKLIHRIDDSAETMRKRIENYLPRAKAVMKYYDEKGEVTKINGEGSIEEVHQLIQNIS